MQVNIVQRPAYSLGVLTLAPNEPIRAESGAMVSMSYGITLQTNTGGGVWKALKRSVVGGESFFQNVYVAPPQGGEVTVAPSLPGDLYLLNVHQYEQYFLQSGAYVASELSVEFDTSWGGARSFFGTGGGLFMLRTAGNGQIVVSAYGAIIERVLQPGEVYTVDTGHIVAFTQNMQFNVRPVGGLKSTFFSGEGLVVDLTGPGRVLIQTRSISAFLDWLIPKIPKREN
ncbi:uncharacterized protein (TIGR00266 family) [Thermosporothrix hazakensis]|jgi:uncharacterized protein (TIGR00266 family)|uniref:Uncharacterized protein (TIGR00266 family) n=2 Tax=Thermosporothrix TaxID=768650 RepID=A0A326UH86_THEHA|nr:TIGR00266 family protein [Thermosporothrix hazakensis]PZW36290.1 uncharacterized protein (TIGR00266 family) [Thermosporothrix hazakensis]BBH88756.1 TIGR00266 family protein [Thermosporothrix sp. COM3]GCE46940.1 TIGR00266 family protein [Thermosporothrix hazakensis]